MGQDDPSVQMVYIAVPAEMQEQIEAIVQKAMATPSVSNAQGCQEDERQVYEQTDRLGDLVIQRRLQAVSDQAQMREVGRNLAQSGDARVKNQGLRPVNICTLRGGTITIATPYFSRNCHQHNQKRGCYPILVLLGIHGGYTPALVDHISQLAATMGSVEEAHGWLGEQGIAIGVNTIRKLMYRYAQRVRAAQALGPMAMGQTASGRRVVISVDGGRIRIRTDKRGPKTKKGRTRYHTKWREPKLLLIYVIDQEGRMDRSWTPVIDGLLKGPDAIFRLIRYYLTSLKIEQCDQVLFVADGARWIWNRVSKLLSSFHLRPDQVFELVDFYHAVEHLTSVAQLRQGWTEKERRHWVKKQRGRLLKDEVNQVISAVDELCQGRSSKKIRRERNYFHKNANRMNYKMIADHKLPIGSGAVESVIRRVVNLRLKGAGIFWHKDSADAMLLLRSYYKAHRAHDLRNLAFTPTLDLAA